MNVKDIQDLKAQLNARLEEVEVEKNQLVRKLKAIDVLLEGDAAQPMRRVDPIVVQSVTRQLEVPPQAPRKHASHAKRVSDRISLIDAVKEIAMSLPGTFDSVQILNGINTKYPEFKLTETKHISSQLSDLVKREVLVVVSSRVGKNPNIYRVA